MTVVAARALLVSTLLLVVLAGPVSAQYDPTTSTVPAPPTTLAPTTTEPTPEPQPGTPSTLAPETPIIQLPPLDDVIEAGGTLTVAGPRSLEFPPDAVDEAEVVLSTVGADQTSLLAQVTVTVVDGRLVVDVVVPADTPEQILILTIVATDVDGVVRTMVVLVPVRQPPPLESAEPQSGMVAAALPDGRARADAVPSPAVLLIGELPKARPADVPPIVAALQASVPDDATEQELLHALTRDPGSDLVIDDAQILVSSRVDNAPLVNETTSTAAAAAVILGCVGMASFRRRRAPARAGRSRRRR